MERNNQASSGSEVALYRHPESRRRLGPKTLDTDDNSLHSESEWGQARPTKFPIKDERDGILRKVRSVLNKISLVNYNKLGKRWFKLIPTDSTQLTEVIRLVVSKAVDEPMYMQIYARLFGLALSMKDENPEMVRKLEISLFAYIHQNLQRLATDIEIAKFERAVDRETYSRQRKCQIHRFIAELYMEGVCGWKFVAEKTYDLICQGQKNSEESEEHLECLCVLLSFCGSKLEREKGEWLNNILTELNLEELACSRTISKRIQFMILDFLEMRSKGWVNHNKWWTPSVPQRV